MAVCLCDCQLKPTNISYSMVILYRTTKLKHTNIFEYLWDPTAKFNSAIIILLWYLVCHYNYIIERWFYSRNLEGSILNKALSVKYKFPSCESGPERVGEGDLDGSWLVELQTTIRNLYRNIRSLHKSK